MPATVPEILALGAAGEGQGPQPAGAGADLPMAVSRAGSGKSGLAIVFTGAAGSGSLAHRDALSLLVVTGGQAHGEAPGDARVHADFGASAAHGVPVAFERDRGEVQEGAAPAGDPPASFAEIRHGEGFTAMTAVLPGGRAPWCTFVARDVVHVTTGVPDPGGLVLVVDRLQRTDDRTDVAFQLVTEEAGEASGAGAFTAGGETRFTVRSVKRGAAFDVLPWPRFEKLGCFHRNLLRAAPETGADVTLAHVIEATGGASASPRFFPVAGREGATGIALPGWIGVAAGRRGATGLFYRARGGVNAVHVLLGLPPDDAFDVETAPRGGFLDVRVARGGAIRSGPGGMLVFRAGPAGQVLP